jgi:hypothetical protein|nr:MAG TPA: hypothetical protein [Caudoviricetes sp.]
MKMSTEYPCVYFEKDGKCRKFSDDTTTSYCVLGPCPEQKRSNADRIRAMSDEEMETELLPLFEELCEDGIPSTDYMRFWLQQPAEEDT